jgi:hypothetical protein
LLSTIFLLIAIIPSLMRGRQSMNTGQLNSRS